MAWNTLKTSLEILRLEEQKLSSRGMEKLSQDDQRELLRVIESEDGLTVEKEDVGGRDGEETDTDSHH